MGCVASRTPVGENLFSSEHEKRACETWARLQLTHTSDGEQRCAHTLQAFLLSSIVLASACVWGDRTDHGGCVWICIKPASVLVHHMLDPRLGLHDFIVQSWCMYSMQWTSSVYSMSTTISVSMSVFLQLQHFYVLEADLYSNWLHFIFRWRSYCTYSNTEYFRVMFWFSVSYLCINYLLLLVGYMYVIRHYRYYI